MAKKKVKEKDPISQINSLMEDFRRELGTKTQKEEISIRFFNKYKGELNNLLRDLPEAERENMKALYKNELEFLNGVTNTNIDPAKFISENPILLGKVLKGEKIVEPKVETTNDEIKDEIDIEAEVQEEPEIKKISEVKITSKYKDAIEINRMLTDLEEYKKESKKVLRDLAYEEEYEGVVERLKEVKEKMHKVYHFLHLAADRKNYPANMPEGSEVEKEYKFMNDKMQEARELDTIIGMFSGSFEMEEIENEVTLENAEEKQKRLIELQKEFERARTILESRLRYYSGDKEKFKSEIAYFEDVIKLCDLPEHVLEVVEVKLKILETQIEKSEELEKSKEVPRKSFKEMNEEKKDLPEEDPFIIDDDLFDEFFDDEFKAFKAKRKPYISNEGEFEKLSDEEFYINSLKNEEKEAKIAEEKTEKAFTEKTEKAFTEKTEKAFKGPDTKVEEKKADIDLEELAEKIRKNGEEVMKSLGDNQEKKKPEEIKKVNPVVVRLNKMMDKKEICSKDGIDDRISEIYGEMLEEKTVKKSIFSPKRPKQEFGNMKEQLFMDLRTIFSRLNQSEPFLDEQYADKFALEIFRHGEPRYMYGDMDEKLEREFKACVARYIEKADTDILSDEEKKQFEIFVLQPYLLREIEKDQNDLSKKLKDDTLSMEEVVANSLDEIDTEVKKEKGDISR